MLSIIYSAALYGIDAYLLTVEVDAAKGLPAFNLVGLPDTAVRESKERVEAAVKNSGYKFPPSRITVNLAPADIKKEGSALDLPIAIGILSATGTLKPKVIDDYLVTGELSLEGTVRDVKGTLSIALLAKELKLKGVLVPPGNAREAAVVEGINVYSIESLAHAVTFLNGQSQLEPVEVDKKEIYSSGNKFLLDFNEVKGQAHAKRALEVSAAGGHNALMLGPPGAGKTMLARRFGSILPNLTLDESLETTKVHSIAGNLGKGKSLITERPFRSPHHTISSAGLIGGGTIPTPGEVSFAHNGVLFLDELPEFHRNVLEVMRQPMEDRMVTISRAARTLTFPAAFSLIASMNPCPCGYYGSPVKECLCTARQISRYMSRISGPLMDRIDIHIEIPALKFKELDRAACGESSKEIKTRVSNARAIQTERFKESHLYCNAQMDQKEIRKYCQTDEESRKLLQNAINRLGLSARAYDRILKVSRTIADLDKCKDIKVHHIAEAIQYRSLDRLSKIMHMTA